MKNWVISLSVVTCLFVPIAAHGQAEVSYTGGLLTIRCNETPLVQVFEQIKTASGIELFLEDSVKTTRLTAAIDGQPAHLALERLLAGSGVNYAISFDPQDWTRVTKIFIGGGGGGPSTPAPQATSSSRSPVRRPVRRAAPAADDYYEEDADMMEDEELPEEFPEDLAPEDLGPDGGFQTPGGAESPGVNNPPSYPRSPFTPGIESSPFANTNPRGRTGAQSAPSQQEADPAAPPPAYYPFLDPFGRPIPVPPEAQQQQQQRKKNNPQNP